MLWVTRSKIRVNRAATGWLVRRFIDPEARFCFVSPEDVARVQAQDRAIGFDAPGARYPHRDPRGRCSFEILVEEYRPEDGALRALAGIVHGADFPQEASQRGMGNSRIALGSFDTVSALLGGSSHSTAPPESVGLRAISQGFPLVVSDDQETLARSGFLYDALYASIRNRLGM